jgi:hypothetical protein
VDTPFPDLEQEPRTLGAAKQRLRELQALVLASRTGKARLGPQEEPSPNPARVIVLPTSRPVPVEPASPELPPTRLKAALGNTTNQELKRLLGVETSRGRKTYNARFVAELYAELKARGIK